LLQLELSTMARVLRLPSESNNFPQNVSNTNTIYKMLWIFH
jgi:hypothetical protein